MNKRERIVGLLKKKKVSIISKYTYEVIAKKVGVSKQYVHQIAQEFGLTRT